MYLLWRNFHLRGFRVSGEGLPHLVKTCDETAGAESPVSIREPSTIGYLSRAMKNGPLAAQENAARHDNLCFIRPAAGVAGFADICQP
ncbi:hypothetical protein D6T64_02190 [Cryobacterium melibiosiphilum]|uniref:Uncharacterized protein n=1 Tax=Cryobacterium melibiosiphilum TaxID=995039 RepID=A0A3A5MVD9_9MICO|nr:hypothetical protein D6T64_02190 [Cryobacterium melibiosiphilum]